MHSSIHGRAGSLDEEFRTTLPMKKSFRCVLSASIHGCADRSWCADRSFRLVGLRAQVHGGVHGQRDRHRGYPLLKGLLH